MKSKSSRSFLEVLSESIASGAQWAYQPNFHYGRGCGVHLEIALSMRKVSIKNRIYHASTYISALLARSFYNLSFKEFRYQKSLRRPVADEDVASDKF